MNKAIGLVLLAVGIALLVYGEHASDSVNSSVSRFFTGNPTDKTIWFFDWWNGRDDFRGCSDIFADAQIVKVRPMQNAILARISLQKDKLINSLPSKKSVNPTTSRCFLGSAPVC
jgi:Protein of unknown function (DUF3185)